MAMECPGFGTSGDLLARHRSIAKEYAWLKTCHEQASRYTSIGIISSNGAVSHVSSG